MKTSLSSWLSLTAASIACTALSCPSMSRWSRKRLAVSSESVKDEAAGLSEGQRVAFNGIGVVVRLEPQLLLDLSKDSWRQRTQTVQLFLQPRDGLKYIDHLTFVFLISRVVPATSDRELLGADVATDFQETLSASLALGFHIIIRLDEDGSPIETKYSGCQGRGEFGLSPVVFRRIKGPIEATLTPRLSD